MDSHRRGAALSVASELTGDMRHILILGGTAEARQLAAELAKRCDLAITLSLAGRTAQPTAQAVPVRLGGFGGVQRLAAYLAAERIDLLVDATHPYAAVIAANAAAAAQRSGVPILALRRPPWDPVAGDRWIDANNIEHAVSLLGASTRRVFLAIGRKEVGAFAAAPQHHYQIRSVDPVDPPLAVPNANYIVARGPFSEAEERALLERHRIEVVVAKNSGGTATYGKIAAARALGIEVVMLRRPALPSVPSAGNVKDAVAWLDHALLSGAERGV
jgi:precorrin-6A/cobalt-precorrin-6A reductase